MSLQALLKTSLILSVLLSAHKILALELNSMIIEPYSHIQSLQDIPNLSNSDEKVSFLLFLF